MNKQKTQLIFTAFLVVVFVFFLVKNLKPKKAPPKAKTEPAQTERNAVVERTTEGKDTFGREERPPDLDAQKKRAQQPWGRDPFSRVSQKGIYKDVGFELKGVSVAKDKQAYAFINEQIVTVGDSIADYEVAEIQRNKVLLKKEDESFYLVLPEE